MKRYVLGNCLRGYFEGEFTSQEDAWRWLSKRFLLAFPSGSGRTVDMYVHEKNHYGLEQWVRCQGGVTSINHVCSEDAIERCKFSSTFIG